MSTRIYQFKELDDALKSICNRIYPDLESFEIDINTDTGEVEDMFFFLKGDEGPFAAQEFTQGSYTKESLLLIEDLILYLKPWKEKK